MSATRRSFLTGAAAAMAATATRVRTAGMAELPPAAGDQDEMVADAFCGNQQMLLDVDQSQPHVGVLMYGLLCLDRKSRELLVPNAAQAGITHVHTPRLWAFSSAGGPAVLTPWNIEGYALSFEAVTASGAVVTATGSLKTRDHLKRRPWHGMRWVRSLKQHTGQDLLAANDRDDTDRVSARVLLSGGTVSAVQPYSKAGSNCEWETVNPSGTRLIQATTDAMQWTRQLPQDTAAIRIAFRPMRRAPAMGPVTVKLDNNRVLLAITNATAMATTVGQSLAHTKAFALLLENVNGTYPIPTLVPGGRGFQVGLSSSDGHCECASN